jgi:ABC-type iron transport system FetAB ATPase subunit
VLRVEQLKAHPLPAMSFEVADGECLGVEGPSGSGKSRLLRALADLDPASGHVLLDGTALAETPAPQWRKLVRYMAAEPAWWTDTARQAMPDGVGKSASARRDRLMASLGLAAVLLERPLRDVSTGERQRLALVRALLDEPKVLLLDEPTGALDPASVALVEELIRFQLLSGRIVLLVSHDPRQLDRLAHRRLQLGPVANGRAAGAAVNAASISASGAGVPTPTAGVRAR